MDKEIEATFTGIDADDIRAKLKALNAVCVQPERLMKRSVFDFPEYSLEKRGGWVRVRDEGDKVTSSYKEESSKNIDGTIESQVVVDSFEQMCAIYEHIGLVANSYQETRRESWKLGDVEIEIDTWPWIPTFLEVEGLNEQAVKDVADKLQLDWNTALFGDVTAVYTQYYDIAPEKLYKWPEIVFGPVPEWLEPKRKNITA